MNRLRKYKRERILFLIVLAWIFLGLSGISQIYHQDEHRWAMIADGSDPSPGPHPPMFRILLTLAGRVFGFDHLRILPFIFSIFNLILVYLISEKISKERNIALISAGLFSLNCYSLIAGLQIDIDGALLPFFVLAGSYVYYRLKEGKDLAFWAPVFFGIIAGGFLTKLSFVVFIGSIILEYSLELYREKKLKITSILKYAPMVILPLVITGGLFYYFNSGQASVVAQYGSHFKSLNFSQRDYFELGFKIMKSFVWFSPLLALSVLLGLFSKEILKKYRHWYLYLFLNCLFYLVIFDFSKLTVERYFMFLIAPSVIISAEVIFSLYKKIREETSGEWMAATGVFLIFSSLILSLDHLSLPLNPKSAYIDQIKNLHFNFIIPFSGGSGPVGFYFSAIFILLSWFMSLIFLVCSLRKNRFSFLLFVSFIVFGVGYNILMIDEYINGGLYGSSALVTKNALNFVVSEPTLKEILTYNDIGAYELKNAGKYGARFYTAPTRDYTDRMSAYRGHYLIIDFPEIDKPGRYWNLIKRCPEEKRFEDKRVTGYIFDCTKIQ